MVDILRIRDDGDGFFMLMRFPVSSKDALLRASGREGVLIREDLEHYSIAWLPGDTGRQVELAWKVAETHTKHKGLVLSKSGYGIRANKEDIAAIKESQGQSSEHGFFVRGLHPSMTQLELAEVIKGMKWNATIVPEGRKVFRGSASWRVTAAQAPEQLSISLNYGYLRCNVQVQPLGVVALKRKRRISARISCPQGLG